MIPTGDKPAFGEPKWFVYTCDGYRIEYLEDADPSFQGVSLSADVRDARLFSQADISKAVAWANGVMYGTPITFHSARLR